MSGLAPRGDKMVSLLRLFSWVTSAAFSNTQRVALGFFKEFARTALSNPADLMKNRHMQGHMKEGWQ